MITNPGVTKISSERNLPENAKVSLDRRLDKAAQETFPTSDRSRSEATHVPDCARTRDPFPRSR